MNNIRFFEGILRNTSFERKMLKSRHQMQKRGEDKMNDPIRPNKNAFLQENKIRRLQKDDNYKIITLISFRYNYKKIGVEPTNSRHYLKVKDKIIIFKPIKILQKLYVILNN